jgi:hypothetical protein
VFSVLEKAKNLLNKAMEQVNKTLTVKARIESLQGKLLDLMNNSRHALDFSQLAATLNERNLQTKITITVNTRSFDYYVVTLP